MTPEKRPAEEESENVVSKKSKEDCENVGDCKNNLKQKDEESEDSKPVEEPKEDKNNVVVKSNKVENNGSEKSAAAEIDESSQDSVKSETASDTSGVAVASSESSVQRLHLPKEHGTLVFCGCAQWDFIGKRNQKGIPSMTHFSPRTIKGLLGIKIAYVASHGSASHGVLITSDGKVLTFGRNGKGQLGLGDVEPRSGFNSVETLQEFNIVQAAVGRNHTLFLTDRGTVFACGDNKSGQCGVGTTTPVLHTPCRIVFKEKESKITKIACGAEFSMIIDNKGYLHSFGLPEYGQLGHNTDGKFFVTCSKLTYQFETKPRRVPVFVERAKDGHPTPVTDVQIVDVSCGNNHTVCVDSRKRAYSWGFGGYGRLGHAEPKDEMVPRIIKFFDGQKRGVNRVYCGATFTIGRTDMGVFLWGQTKRSGEANMYPKPIQDLFGWDVRDIGCSNTSVMVAADRSVIAWGPSPTYGELGLGENTKSSTQPKEVKQLDGALVYQISCGYGFSLLLVKNDEDEDKAVLSKLKEIEL